MDGIKTNSSSHQSHMNPFNIEPNEIKNLTPRRKEYIEQRNAAQEERINSIADSILQYQTVIDVVRERFKDSGLEDQYSIKPYLTFLYFEIGESLEEQGKPEAALRYYKQAGFHGHLPSIEGAKRLGSKFSFVSTENTNSRKDKFAFFEALRDSIVLIKKDGQKGSGFIAKSNKLGVILITVKHVSSIPGAIAYIGEREFALEDLEPISCGSNTLFPINSSDVDFKNAAELLMNVQLILGEKVYFGGYPFKKKDAHLHTGKISFIGRNGKFSIDGVAVPGMSGGPIAIEREGKLYVVGTIASETFDPIDGFSKALNKMYFDQADNQLIADWAAETQKKILREMGRDLQYTTIPREEMYIADLGPLTTGNPNFFGEIWDDLNKNGIISNSGTVDSEKIIHGQLGLREEFQSYEDQIISCLKARTGIGSIDPDQVEFPYHWQKPTDSVNTVGLSLVQSLSTGVITGNLFRGFPESVSGSKGAKSGSDLVIPDEEPSDEESSELEIGRKNRFEKNKTKLKKKPKEERKEAIQNDTFQNTGCPRILYRYVSSEAAKNIRKNGIEHSGTNHDEIPFLTAPDKGKAISVGAVFTEKLVVIYPDRIPNLSKDNVRQVAERSGIVTFRINTSIPKGAIKILEA